MKQSNAFPRVFALLLVCGAAFPIPAFTAASSVSGYSSRVWQMEDGLPHTIVQAITQTSDGFLWIGTREGLARFDGVRFLTIDFPGKTTHPFITSLCEGKDGALWIGTVNAGLFRLQAGHLFFFGPQQGFRSASVSAIQETSDGVVWIGCDTGLACFKNGRIQFPFEKKIRSWIKQLFLDYQGVLWIVTGDGIKRLESQKLADYIPPRGLIAAIVKCVYNDPGGTLWLGDGAGIGWVKNGSYSHSVKVNDRPRNVGAIVADRRGNMWLGMYGGLSRFRDGQFIDSDGPTYRAYAIFEDREGNLWIGSEEGLIRLTPKLFTNYAKEQGLSQNVVVSVYPGRDGSIWIGTWGGTGGLNQLKDGRNTIFNAANGLTSDFIMGLCESRDGSIWIGTDYGGGLYRLHDGKFTHYGTADGLDTDIISDIVEDKSGTLWIGTRVGLYSFQEGKFTRHTTKDGISHNKINALYESQAGVVWIGTDGGLTRWSGGQFTNLARNGPKWQTRVLSLHEDSDHTLWIGTRGDGLERLMDGKIDVFTSQQGLFSDSIYSILEDERGNLWLNSSKGIFRVNKESLNQVARGLLPSFASVRYGKTDGILSSGQYWDVAQPSACKGLDGRLWFRTTQGVAVVDPAAITTNTLAPPVVIEAVITDKKQIQGRGPLPSLELARQTLDIPPGRGEMEFHYAALSFRAPEKNRFRYKLEGFDQDWVEAGTRDVAYYNNLAPGDYRFRVVACNNDGVWNETGARIALVLEPHFWQTKWFVGLVALTVVGSAAGAARHSTRKKMQRTMELLEQKHALEKERTRIAQDMHDDLGARLTEILLLSDLARQSKSDPDKVEVQINKISQAGRDVARNLNALVWAVNPSNDSAEKLAAYLCKYAEKFLSATPIRYRLDAPVELPACLLTSEVRHNIFLVVKEALNNVVKHSGASEVRIRFEAGAVLCIMIEDNGRGFSTIDAADRGNGLQNMEKRLRNMGARFSLRSAAGCGTQIRLEIPLKTGPSLD